jgi:hypothetical protein
VTVTVDASVFVSAVVVAVLTPTDWMAANP